uniref:Uncharacterized protein n=1 Tax=Arundo donax TaxID=35708 RepID=A0A0A8YNF5_ARUDO
MVMFHQACIITDIHIHSKWHIASLGGGMVIL